MTFSRKVQPVLKPWHIGNRDANADVMQRDYRATVAIDCVRAYVLRKYGADLTIGTARRLLGDLIQTCALTVDAAEELPLEAAMDKLDAAESSREQATGEDGQFIEHLLAGPDDVELTPREMALLEARLRQPVSFTTIQQEKKATGHSPIEAARNKLVLIRDFNRGLQAKVEANTPEKRSEARPTDGPTEPAVAAKLGEGALNALLRVFTNGLADDRIKKATRLLSDAQLTANEKLTKIDALIPFPATASAEQLGEMLGVTKQAVLKTDWWTQNRRGEKDNEVGRRRAGHQKRA